LIRRGCASGSRRREWVVDTSDGQKRECATLLGAEDVTEGGAVDDCVDILARCAITTPPDLLCASTSDLVSGAGTTEL